MIEPKIVGAADLPASPLDAADMFYDELLPVFRKFIAEEGDTIIAFEYADPSHDGWRLAAVQELARESVPSRVNGLVGGISDAMHKAALFIAYAPGVTGQIFTIDAIEDARGYSTV